MCAGEQAGHSDPYLLSQDVISLISDHR